jgi:CO dehydrogenase maturation factor
MPGTVVVADMEAGLEHLSWAGGTLRYVDALLVVVQPTAKTMMTAERTHRLALELGIPEIGFVGSRASGPDVDRLAAFAAERGCELYGAVPDDEAVRTADRAALCVLDVAPRSEAVTAIERLADRLEERFVHRLPVG